MAKIPELVAAYGQKVTFTADPKNPYFTYHLKKNSRDKNVDIKSVVEQFLAVPGNFWRSGKHQGKAEKGDREPAFWNPETALRVGKA